MALRNGHGTGSGQPRIEVLPADELPAGVAATAGPAADRDGPKRAIAMGRNPQVAKNPLSVLKSLENGTLTRGEVEALKVVSPKLLEQIRTRAMDMITEGGTDLPYEERIQLGILLDIPADPSLRPEFIRIAQSIYAPEEHEAREQLPSPRNSPQVAKDFSSRVEALEAGHGEAI